MNKEAKRMVTRDEERLTISYWTSEKVNTELDGKIKEFARKLGYFFGGSGYNFSSGFRDMSFYKKIPKEHPITKASVLIDEEGKETIKVGYKDD